MKKLTLFSLLVYRATCFGQDLHFSQTSEIPTLINPASAGVFDGYQRVIINQRNQWLGSSTTFSTTNLSADINLMKTRRNDKAYLGLGILLFNDIGGDAKIGTQTAAITFSGILPIADGHFLSAGIQAGYGSRKADLNRLTWANQWNGTSYNQDLPSFESNNLSGFNYADLGAGLFYHYESDDNSFARENSTKFQLGFATHHVNQPSLRFMGTSNEKLFRKFVIHSNFIKEFTDSKWGIEAKLLQFFQGPHSESLLGAALRYRLQNGTKITGLNRESHLIFGTNFRIKDAIIPMVAIQYQAWRFGVSYDITVSKLRRTNAGSLEFSLSFTNLHDALYRKRSSF